MDLNQIIEFAAGSDQEGGPDRVAEIRDQLDASGADPAQIEASAVEAFNAAYNDGNYDLEDAPAMELLADVTDAARTLNDHKKSKQKNVDDLLKRVNKTKKGTDDEEDRSSSDASVSDDQAQDEGQEGEEADAEGRGGVRRSGDSGRRRPVSSDDEDEDDDSGKGEKGKHSSRKKVSLSASELNSQRNQGMPRGRALRSITLTAGADVPDMPQGKQLDMREFASAARARAQSMPVGQQTAGEVRRSIATINRVFDDSLVVDGQNPMADAEKIDALADERNLPGGSLVAAAQQQHDALVAEGGPQAMATPPGDIWCSPSETDYSLCPALADKTTGILDLPSFQVKRGGIRYPVWKQFPDQHRPIEHGPGDQEESNDQAQGWYPSHDPAQDYPYDAQHTSDGPRHDWHGYAHLNSNTIGGREDLQDPDYFIRNPKKAIFGPCVEWAEERMHSAYLWIEEDILRNHTYPELAERFMNDALVSHARYMNETYIRWIVAHSDRLDPFWAGAPGWGGPGDPPRNGVVPPGPMSYPVPVSTNNWYPGSAIDYGSYGLYGMGSAAEAVLERIGYLATWFRDVYRQPFTTSLEGFAPFWFREFLKVDIERKLNRQHKLPVSNAEVDAYLRQWGVRLQWVYDWQQMPSTEYSPKYDDVMSSHIMPRGGWPNAVDIVLYPAGSWVKAEQEIIRLDSTYDSNRLRNNRFTSLFLEDAWMLLNRCNRSFVVQLRGLCQNGATGSPQDPCSSDYIPARREQIKAGDGGAHEPPQNLVEQPAASGNNSGKAKAKGNGGKASTSGE